MSKQHNKRGFTIVELVIVIAVIAILAAVLIPTFSNLIKKANMSVDMQIVNQMNTALQADEIVSGKPATVVEAKEILAENGCDDFTPHDSQNVFYWIGAENRVILWEKDEPISAAVFVVVASADDGAETGKVTYPKELAKKYKDITEPSDDWADLANEYSLQVITPEEDQTLEQALFAAVNSAAIEDHTVFALPESSTLTFTVSDFQQFYSATATQAGDSRIGKDVTIDLNGGKIEAAEEISGYDDYQFYVFPQGNLTLCNGTLDLGQGYSGFTVANGASLVLRDVKLTDSSYATFFPASTASEVVLENCTIEANGIFGLSTNGLTSDDIKVVIKNTKFVNNYTHAIILNVHSNLYVENSHIEGPVAAVAMRSGHAEIVNSTLKANDPEPGSYGWEDFTHFDQTYHYWSDGNKMPGACLVLGDHSSVVSAYEGAVDCVLNNVKFETAAVPTVLLAAKAQKNVALTYDDTSNVDTYVLYDFPHAEGNGTVTVNGANVPFSEHILPDLVTKEFAADDRYTIPAAAGTYPGYQQFDVSVLNQEVDGVNILEALKAHFAAKGLNLTDAQWATAKFAAGGTANVVKTIVYERNA